jgi:DNA (cytosine-5)-methyltransferase 1
MKVGSLFSGIGGLDLGLERAGMDVIWQSEIDPYACKVLDKHWPTVPNLGNIKEIDWSQVERPDVICGGYPCQPFSTAGKRQGEGDARHLWPCVRECIAELRPRYAVLENVRGHLSLGFGTVLGDLASIGYDTEWQVIPAAAVGAPHRRDRVFIVAYSAQQSSNGESDYARDSKRPKTISEPRDSSWESHRSRQWWAIEPDVGRVANGIPNRVDRLRCLGNAVVPQVAEYVGRLIMAAQ